MKKLLLSFLALFLFFTTSKAQEISLAPFADGFSSPLELVNAGDERLFVVEQGGVIKILNLDGTTNSIPFLDISPLVNAGGERGLLGMAFHPEYANNGFFYVHYSDLSGDTQISRFSVDPEDSNIADPQSEMPILNVNQPQSNHNGGTIAFGTDGYLYIALGDGGGGGDTANNAQNRLNLLGSLLRIDVDNPEGNNNYGIPDDNPFVDNPDARDEIWAYGLRNPYRFSIDDEANDIWIGDVGQGGVEEVNKASLTEAGINYGWRCYEGSEPFNTSNCPPIEELTFPVAEYPWSPGGSVTGGYVYRGSIYTDLQGVYIFADIDGMISTVDSDLNFVDQGDFSGFWVAFGEDINEELYIVSIGGSILKVQGSQIASVPENEPFNFTIAPNPGSNIIEINSENNPLATIQVMDLKGSLLFSEAANSSQKSIDISGLSQGLYLIRITSETGIQSTKKLVVE